MDDKRKDERALPASLGLVACVSLVALLASSAEVLGQGCPEPADVPPAEPLRVERVGSSRVNLSWDPVAATGYRMRRGNLDGLWSSRDYTHLTVDEDAVSPLRLAVPRDTGHQNFYFLVTATCTDESSSAGRDSEGVERPIGGMVEFGVELTTAPEPIQGMQTELMMVSEGLIAATDVVAGAGPYDDPANSPQTLAGLPPPQDTLIVGQIMWNLSASFEAPAMIYTVRFGYHGATPTVDDFALTRCMSSNILGVDVGPSTCSIVDFTVQY